jgi:spore coat protein SA
MCKNTVHLKPRVAIITPGTFPIPSPNSSSVETVVEQLTGKLQNELDFLIFGKKTEKLPSTQILGNIMFFRIIYRKWHSYVKQVVGVLSEQNVDIIQVENRPKFISPLRKTFPDKQIWLSLHSTKFIGTSHISKEELQDAFMMADKIIVNSYFLKNYLLAHINCDFEKIHVNHLGVDVEQFPAKWTVTSSESVRLQQLHHLEGKNILLFVGRLRKIKGVHLLLRALPIMINQNPNTVLVIVGSAFYGKKKETDYVRKLRESAEKLHGHVLFIPYVPHNEIQHWFQVADIVLVPSIGSEAFGLVNVEAMASGVPVIATNYGGMPEIIQHGKTGFLLNKRQFAAELPSYVNKLLQDRIQLNRMGIDSVSHCMEHFTWDASAQRLLKLYLDAYHEKTSI